MRRLALLLGPCLALLLGAAASPSAPQSRMDDPRWAAEYRRKQAQLDAGPHDVVLLGDSIVHELDHSGGQDWNDFRSVWNRWFACRRALALGFTGDTTANLLWRIQNGLLPRQAPGLFVVLIGTNNNRASLGWSARQTADAIHAVVAALHTRYPAAATLVLGVPPNAQGPRVAALIDQTNALLAGTDWAPLDAHYLPTADLFEQGGVLDPALYREPHLGRPPLHPSAQGWNLLAGRIIATAAGLHLLAPGPCAARQ